MIKKLLAYFIRQLKTIEYSKRINKFCAKVVKILLKAKSSNILCLNNAIIMQITLQHARKARHPAARQSYPGFTAFLDYKRHKASSGGPPGLNWGFAIPAPARHIGSPHGLADCKSAGYPAAGLQIQPNEVSG